MTLPIALIWVFVFETQEASVKFSGHRQYSMFTGWQLANNALYIYNQIDVDNSFFPTKGSKELNGLALSFFKDLRTYDYNKFLGGYVGNFFIRQPEAPLKQYFSKKYESRDERQYVLDWADASETFRVFGQKIILHYPIQYMLYFVVPNVKRYFFPPLSHLEIYNYGDPDIEPIAQRWFNYKSDKVHCISPTLQGAILFLFTPLFALANIAFLICLFLVIKFLAHFKDNRAFMFQTMFAALFLVFNFAFSIISTVNILRYQYVPIYVI
ncbi:MAG TPA: hypothetical protein VHD83_04515, partial [Puia sp.]|nr:hypothetical protein [Puia sp.]